MAVGARWVPATMLVLALIPVPRTGAECEFSAVTASDNAKGDGFGPVKRSGDGSVAIIGGAGHDGPGGPDAGVAFVFVRDGTAWVQEADLVPADTEPYQYFGGAVAVSADGRTVVVGADSDNHMFINSGAAYVFVREGTSWSQQAKLVAADPSHSAYFGFAVALSADGNTALIGARFDGEFGKIAGAAYVFVRQNSQWTQQQKLTASDAQPEQEFGYTVALSGDGDAAFIGAPDVNAVYAFSRAGGVWTEQGRIKATGYPNIFFFGYQLAASANADTVLVSTGNNDSLVFVRNGADWTEQAHLHGMFVAVSGDGTHAITGEWQGDTAFVHVRAGSTWRTVGELGAPDAGSFSYFGASSDLSPDGTTAFIAAPGGLGTAYFIGFSCDADLDADGAVGILDFLTLLSSWGTCPSPCPADLNGDGAAGIIDMQLLLVNWSL